MFVENSYRVFFVEKQFIVSIECDFGINSYLYTFVIAGSIYFW